MNAASCARPACRVAGVRPAGVPAGTALSIDSFTRLPQAAWSTSSVPSGSSRRCAAKAFGQQSMARIADTFPTFAIVRARWQPSAARDGTPGPASASDTGHRCDCTLCRMDGRTLKPTHSGSVPWHTRHQQALDPTPESGAGPTLLTSGSRRGEPPQVTCRAAAAAGTVASP